MKRRTVKMWAQRVLCLLLVIPLSGCDMGWNNRMNAKIEDKQLFSTMSRVLDEQLEVVLPYMEDDVVQLVSRGLDGRSIDGQEVLKQALGEQGGREYLEFGYMVATSEDPQQVMDYARNLIPASEFAQLEQKVVQAKSRMLAMGEETARKLPPHQREAFYKDLQKLVVRSIVLLVAGIVYACIPKLMLWGKITAAAAIAIAAGVVATTVMSVWRYYEFKGDADASFEEWLKSVTTEPEASYAIAASVTSMGAVLNRGPIITGLILCVFAIYNVVDMVRPMLKLYNFNA